MKVGKTLSLVRTPLGSWERWETEPDCLGVCTVLCAAWMLNRQKIRASSFFLSRFFMILSQTPQSPIYLLFSILCLIMCIKVINPYLWRVSWGAKLVENVDMWSIFASKMLMLFRERSGKSYRQYQRCGARSSEIILPNSFLNLYYLIYTEQLPLNGLPDNPIWVYLIRV